MDNGQELDVDQESEINPIVQQPGSNGQADGNSDNNLKSDETTFAEPVERKAEAASQSYNYRQKQLQWMNRQVSTLERELLLNNNRALNSNFMSNWIKVIITALAVIVPGIGQIIGIILGLVFISDDSNADKRSYGVALLTVSVVVFIISAIFWFIFALTFGPQIYY